MKKFAADNLMYLRDEYPQIYKYVRGRSYSKESFEPENARNGEAIVTYHSSSGHKQSVYSRYNPSLEADRWARSVEMEVSHARDVLFCGLGFGYHLEAFLKLYPDKRVFLYEPDFDMFMCALEHRDLRPVLKNKKIAMYGMGNDYNTQVDYLESVFSKSDKAIVTVIVPVYRTLYQEAIERYQHAISQTVGSFIASIRTLNRFMKDWARNMISNMAKNISTPSIQGMRGSCQGIPAVIIGSGPSLGMEAEVLKKLKNHTLLIAAGTSIQALVKYGIEPDLVVTMDPGVYNRKAFDMVDMENIPLLYIPTVHSGILERKLDYAMHAFFQLDSPTFYLMKLTHEDPVFQSTATVSGTAIQAAIYLGCQELVFIGQDYSFPGEQFYAEGVGHATEAALAKKMKEQEELVENVQGGQNPSNRTMTISREGIETLISNFKGYRFYNASQVGARIKHTESLTLEELYTARSTIKLEDKWFRSKMEQLLKPYPKERKEAIRSRMVQANRKSFQLAEEFASLEEHVESLRLNEYDSSQLLQWLTKFESFWVPIVDDEVFKFVFGFFLQRELNHLDRYWQGMRDEKDLFVKTTKLLEILLPLIQSWKDTYPMLRVQFDKVMLNPEFHLSEVHSG